MSNGEGRVGADLLREHDEILVRVLQAGDLDAMVRIDKRIVGRSRRDYLEQKLEEALGGSRIMVSLGAEVDGLLAGFLLGRLFYGEFGVADPVAILDTIDVDPERLHAGIGRALFDQFRTNLRAVGIEKIQTQVAWNEWGLLPFLEASGFRPAPRTVLEATL
jgi:GNAT superfamily N-acetyltransferase